MLPLAVKMRKSGGTRTCLLVSFLASRVHEDCSEEPVQGPKRDFHMQENTHPLDFGGGAGGELVDDVSVLFAHSIQRAGEVDGRLLRIRCMEGTTERTLGVRLASSFT